MKILYLIDSLDYSGSARQIHLLGPALTARALSVEICCLGPNQPWADSLRQAGVRVHALGWTRWFDPGVLWKLRDVLGAFAPDLIHVWRMPALRALAAVARRQLPRVVMSAPVPSQGRLGWWDRWLLQQVGCLAVAGVSEQERCLRHRLVRPSLRVVPPAVHEHDEHQQGESQAEFQEGTRSILCIGKHERGEGFRQAIWAFDIFRVLYPESRLLLVGAGSQTPELQALAQGLLSTHQVQFLAERSDVASLLQAAEVVWVPSMANCGRQVALEAMAQARVVVAADVPCLRDVIIDGETGYLVPRGDVIPIARYTHVLFQDAGLRKRVGQAARRQVAQRFTVDNAVERWREVYLSIAG